MIEDLLGPSMSVGTLQGLVERCAKQLEPVEQQIKAALCQADVLHQDETGLYVAGQRHWMHVSATEHLTHYAFHAKRGKEALDAIGILEGFAGVSVHDGWRSYWLYACQHALCNVHHLRDLTFLHEEQQQDWAGGMKTLLLDIKAAVKQARAEGRTPPVIVSGIPFVMQSGIPIVILSETKDLVTLRVRFFAAAQNDKKWRSE